MQNRILSQLLLSMLIFTYLSVINAGAQTLSSENTQNGFTGEYGTGTSKLLVEFQVLAQDSTVSRVKDSGGKTFVESTRQGNVITVKIKDVIQTIQMDQSQPENGSVSELSESDLQKLETFRLSPESENVRKLIIELIKQKGNTHKEQLKGFMVMAVVMGDGPGGGLQANSNRGGMGSKWLLNAFQPSKKMSPPNRKINSNVDTCYCCGFGCACFCWTAACVAHDVCIEQAGTYRTTKCNRQLAAAIVSIYYFC